MAGRVPLPVPDKSAQTADNYSLLMKSAPQSFHFTDIRARPALSKNSMLAWRESGALTPNKIEQKRSFSILSFLLFPAFSCFFKSIRWDCKSRIQNIGITETTMVRTVGRKEIRLPSNSQNNAEGVVWDIF